MLKLNRFVALPALALLCALVIAACGGGDQPTPTPAATATTATTAPATAAPATAAPTTAPAAGDQAPSSPLAQPDSPLTQSSAPLSALPPATDATGRPLHDVEAIRQIAAANTPKTPKEGKASLSGLMFSRSTGGVIPGTLVYLTKAIENNGKLYPPNVYSGPDPSKGDIALYTDEYGRINADDITPGNYVMAVWTVMNYIMIPDPKVTNQADYPLIFQIKAGDKIDLGMKELSWP